MEKIVEVACIDMIHFGLNDMHLALGMKFMFQLLADGSVDRWAGIVRSKGIMYGFGGLASLDGGAVPGRMILKEHYRLGSQMVIVSRSFCNADKMQDLNVVREIFSSGIEAIRELEGQMGSISEMDFISNHHTVCERVNEIVHG